MYSLSPRVPEYLNEATVAVGVGVGLSLRIDCKFSNEQTQNLWYKYMCIDEEDNDILARKLIYIELSGATVKLDLDEELSLN